VVREGCNRKTTREEGEEVHLYAEIKLTELWKEGDSHSEPGNLQLTKERVVRLNMETGSSQ